MPHHRLVSPRMEAIRPLGRPTICPVRISAVVISLFPQVLQQYERVPTPFAFTAPAITRYIYRIYIYIESTHSDILPLIPLANQKIPSVVSSHSLCLVKYRTGQCCATSLPSGKSKLALTLSLSCSLFENAT